MHNNNIQLESNDEWSKMYKKLESLSDEDILVVWNNLINYDPATYYALGIPMDSWAQAVCSEMDRRDIKYVMHTLERRK